MKVSVAADDAPKITAFFSKKVKAKKRGRPKGSTAKTRRPQAGTSSVSTPANSQLPKQCIATPPQARDVSVKKSIKKPVGGNSRGKNKTDWSTEENQQIMAAAVRDWDSKSGKWQPGDTYTKFGAKFKYPHLPKGIPKVRVLTADRFRG